MKTFLIGLLLLATLVVPNLRTPEQIGWWIEQHIWYEKDPLNIWQGAEETLAREKGDCEDFSILAQEMLKKINISSEIIIFTLEETEDFRDGSQPRAHAICVFKEKGKYNYISTDGYKQVEADTIRELCDYSAKNAGAECAREIFELPEKIVQQKIEKDKSKPRS